MSNLRALGDSQAQEAGEPSLRHLQLSQPNAPEEIVRRPSSLGRRPREEQPNNPRTRRRMLSIRSLVIVFEVELASEGREEAVFRGRFHNEDTDGHAWFQVEGLGHYRWLHGPMNYMPCETHLEDIAITMRQIFDFLRL